MTVLSWRRQDATRQADRRDVNERRADTFVCECGDAGCSGTVDLSRTEYETVRGYGNHFVIVANHENPDAESVVTENGRFAVVETLAGEASKIALRTDPRPPFSAAPSRDMDVIGRPGQMPRRLQLAQLPDEGLFMLIHRPGAAGELFDRLGRNAYGLALEMVGDPTSAQEILYESFLALRGASIPLHAPRGSVRGRYTALVHRRAAEVVRGEKHRRSSERAEPRDRVGPGTNAVDRARALTLLRRLPPAQLEVIELAYFDALTPHEIATRLSEPVEVIGARMLAGLEGMREMLVVPPVTSVVERRLRVKAVS